jgi:hypothetical protein
MQPVPAAEFTRDFGRYRALAEKGAVPVSSGGRIAGYFVRPDEYAEFERFRSQRRAFAMVDLTDEEIQALAASRMDPRHDHLNALLDDE